MSSFNKYLIKTKKRYKNFDFTNVILIMTSNIGANEIIKEKVGFLANFTANDNEKEVNSFFSPEFRNRLDSLISFSTLPMSVIMRVVEKFVLQLEAQLMDKNVTFDLTTKASEWLAKNGYDKIFGARPLNRLIQEKIKNSN